jgi:SAM-dependent methyltransferase
MKTKCIIISFLLALFSCANVSAQIMSDKEYEVQSRRIEEWEKKINEERQPPEKVMDAIGVKPGMIIGEVGAGRGRYTVHLARRVGSEGKIFANDIDNSALSYLRERCRRNNIQNIETILGKVNDPLFPEQSLDMVIMVWVYHMLEQPIPLLKNLRSSLKPGATVVILDPPDEEIDEEIKELKGKIDPDRPTIKERIEEGGAEAGFELVRIETFLPKDAIYILKVKSL